MGTETGGMSKGKGVSWPVCLRTSSSGDLGASRTVPWCRSSNYDLTIHRLLLVCHRGDFRSVGGRTVVAPPMSNTGAINPPAPFLSVS